MPDGWTLVQPAATDATPDGWTLVQRHPPAQSGVRVGGDTFADKIRNAASVLGHTTLGALKGAAHTALDIGELGANAGMLPGLGTPGMAHPSIDAGRAATAYDGTAERIGGGLETAAELALPAMEAGKLALAGGRALATKAAPLAVKAAPALTRLGNSTVLDFASHVPGIGTPVHWARTGAKVIGHILDMAAEKAAVKAAPNAGGRVVAASEPTLNQSLASALEELRQPAATPPVQLPPSAELPPGYTPRATAPKPKPIKMAAPAAEPTAPPQRAYFLKPEADLAAATETGPRAKPSGNIRVEDLPASWQARVGQDLFPMTDADAKAAGEAFLKELTDRGVSVGKAMMAVSKNPDVPVQIRQQLLKTLSRVTMKGAQ